MADEQFKGFSSNTISFFLQLSQNNNEAWFEAHRQQYEKTVLGPSRTMVETLGRSLVQLTTGKYEAEA